MRSACEFQSRSGFSARRDASRSKRGSKVPNRFNPVVGFLLVATFGCDRFDLVSGGFQSRSGFSARRDTRWPPSTASVRCFNPVVGFLLVATDKTRPLPDAIGSFNPVVGFLLVATRRSCTRRRKSSGFNPVVGFLLVATVLTSRLRYRTIPVSIP